MTKQKRISFSIFTTALAILLFIFCTQNLLAQIPTFTEVRKDFPRTEKNLRKWDAPVVADLDQDGYLDLILNDHGLGISICWNNKGKFAKPYDLIMGDLHGVSVGDFDMDGNLELIISRGGGSGSNARNSKMYRVDKERNFTALKDFDVPLALMRGRTVKFIDGDNDGDLDLLNFAFPDKSKKGESENYIYQNNGDRQLVLATTLPPSKIDGQKTLTTDFNGDNILDLLLYGHGKVKAYQGKGDLTYKDVSKKIFPNDLKEVTGIIELDYDNDGDFDLFLTRGKEFEIGETFYDANTKNWGFYSKRGRSNFEDLLIGDVLNITNFQSQWPFNDAYFIGETGYEYKFPAETHSGKDIRLVNSDALGFPDKIEKNKGVHIGYVGNEKWRLIVDTWSPSTGVIQGVNAYPDTTHPKGLNDILLENRKGKFVYVTKKANLFLEEHTVAATAVDLNNDSFQDLVIIKRGDLIHENQALVYLNHGNGRFMHLAGHQIISKELGAIGMAIESLDYNQDGRMDIIIGNERGKWHLFKNIPPKRTSSPHLVVEVGTSPSGKASSLGALVSLQSCKQQIRRVGATGANYSLSSNHQVHFGIGACKGIGIVKVTWSNGETETQTIALGKDKIFIGKN